MSINHDKTKIIMFSRQKEYNFLPELQFIQNQNIEVVKKMKIVGVILRSDLKTCLNSKYILKKASPSETGIEHRAFSCTCVG